MTDVLAGLFGPIDAEVPVLDVPRMIDDVPAEVPPFTKSVLPEPEDYIDKEVAQAAMDKILEPAEAERDLSEFAKQLQADTIACKFSLFKFGQSKTLDRSQKEQAAAIFEATGDRMSASKKLIDTKSVAWRKADRVLHDAKAFWVLMTVPYPDAGIRLIQKANAEEFSTKMAEFKVDLRAAAEELDACIDDIKADAKVKLGALYCDADYSASIGKEFAILFDFVSVEPPDYLKRLHPKLYKEQQERIAAKFTVAVDQAEEAFTAQLSEMVSRLAERLEPAAEGDKAKVFKKSSLEGLQDLFEKFKSFNISSNPELDRLIDDSRRLLDGVGVKELRKDIDLKERIRDGLQAVEVDLEKMMEDRPARKFRFKGE